MELNLESLGFKKEEILQKVVEQVADRVLEGKYYDPENDEDGVMPTRFAKDIEKKILERIDAAVSALADKHVLPNAATYVENICLQETNSWGEKTGTKMTFIEYLVKRAEKYLTEQVSFDGKAKTESNGYSWTASQTRITHLVHQHLHYSIETAMKQAVQEANSAIARGIHETVRLKLNEIATSIKVAVTTK